MGDRPASETHRATARHRQASATYASRRPNSPRHAGHESTRTILDMATFLDDPYELEALVGEAGFRGLASEAELRDQIERNAGRPGVTPLRKVLDIEGGPQRTRSSGERKMLRILRKHKHQRLRSKRLDQRLRSGLPVARRDVLRRARRLGRPQESPSVRARPSQVGKARSERSSGHADHRPPDPTRRSGRHQSTSRKADRRAEPHNRWRLEVAENQTLRTIIRPENSPCRCIASRQSPPLRQPRSSRVLLVHRLGLFHALLVRSQRAHRRLREVQAGE